MDSALFRLSHLYAFGVGLLLLCSVVAAIAYRSLTNELKRNETPQWIALGSPKLFRGSSMRDEWRFFRYILFLEYRKSTIAKVRFLGHVILACLVTMWIIAACLVIFGGFRTYEFHLTFGKN